MSTVRGLAVGHKVTDSRTLATPRGHSGDNSRSSDIKTMVHYTLTIKRVS